LKVATAASGVLTTTKLRLKALTFSRIKDDLCTLPIKDIIDLFWRR